MDERGSSVEGESPVSFSSVLVTDIRPSISLLTLLSHVIRIFSPSLRSQRPIGFADESWPEPGLMGGPCSRHTSAENRRAEHRAFQSGFAIDVAAGHSRDLPRSVKPRNRIKVGV